MLETAKTTDELWRLQGRLRQLREIDSIPRMLDGWIEKLEQERS
jgi:hypothetical protein